MDSTNINSPAPFLKPLGGYRKLRVYKVTEIICDLTYHLLEKNSTWYLFDSLGNIKECFAWIPEYSSYSRYLV